ncbi:hypothetical protein [Nocardia beijingensis]|uniref:hypothetical protein n=1 Tax=Nocardia beijingensis TaxID=95162 RepID=UPI0033B0D0B1
MVVSDLAEVVAVACDFLVEHQDPDGYWRDYVMPPGRSDAWITGCVGLAVDLATGLVPPDTGRTRAVDRAVTTLREARRRGGWGYNRRVRCDADSTSWVVRLLAVRDPEPALPTGVLTKHITSTGAVRTYLLPEVSGSWADEHDEVAPMAGLALLALGDEATVGLIRAHVLNRHRECGRWEPFWWRSDAYVTAQNLTFLASSGGIPPQVAAAEWQRLNEACVPAGAGTEQESSFDTAQRLISAVRLHESDHVDLLCEKLLAAQMPDGGWPASLALLLPDKWDSTTQVFADDRRLLSTAMAVLALLDAVR